MSLKLLGSKALEFLGKLDLRKKETFGFKSNKRPPYVHGLSESESDLVKMVHNVESRIARNNFLSKLRNDTKSIHITKDLLVNAVKSTNIYIKSKELCHKYLTDSYNKSLQKSKEK